METTDLDDTGPYMGVSLAEQIADWRRWQQSGQRPELHAAVRRYDVPPPEKMPFSVLGRISVNDKWEDQGRIQCNVCKVEHKFITDGYMASYDDGYWYVIGPVCGSDEHQQAVARAIREHRDREAEQIAEGIISNVLTNYAEWRDYYYQLRQAVETVFEYHNRFRKIAPNTFRALSDIRKSGGALRIVTRDAGFNEATGRYQPAVSKTVGRLGGAEFFQGNCLTMKALREAVPVLDVYFANERSKLDLSDAVIDATEKGKLQKLQSMLSGALGALRTAHQNVDVAFEALAYENLSALEKWTSNERNEAGLSIRIEADDSIIACHLSNDKPAFELREYESEDGYSLLKIRRSDLRSVKFEPFSESIENTKIAS